MISVRKGDITKVRCDAIVNPANSGGTMGGGVALAIKKAGGEIIEKEAMSRSPVAVGEAVATTGGGLGCKYVIHAPTMEAPAMKIGVENVMLATRAALELARRLKIKSIAFPGMGTGIGGVDYGTAARAMIGEMKGFKDLDIILVGYTDEMADALKRAEKSQVV